MFPKHHTFTLCANFVFLLMIFWDLHKYHSEFVTCNEEICDNLSNIYAGVTTIAGGGGESMRGGHRDGAGDDAKKFC
jgi:hypothetical protein